MALSQRKGETEDWENNSCSAFRGELIQRQRTCGLMVISSRLNMATQPFQHGQHSRQGHWDEREAVWFVCICGQTAAGRTEAERDIGGVGGWVGFNFPLQQISIYTYISLRDFILLPRLIMFKAPTLKDWPLSVLHPFVFCHQQFYYDG